MSQADRLNRATRCAYILVEGFGLKALWPEVAKIMQRDPANTLRLLEEIEKVLQEKPLTA